MYVILTYRISCNDINIETVCVVNADEAKKVEKELKKQADRIGLKVLKVYADSVKSALGHLNREISGWNE